MVQKLTEEEIKALEAKKWDLVSGYDAHDLDLADFVEKVFKLMPNVFLKR
ncbi:13989_t:CDS:2, partial [Gigaspora rosea]